MSSELESALDRLPRTPSAEGAASHAAALLDASAAIPLTVDLDGTLVRSDTLFDSTLALARQHPRALLSLFSWLRQGRAALKYHITQHVTLDVASLPYNQPLLVYLRAQHAAGRSIYLATAADRGLAERIAAHLGIFTGVLASDGKLNLAGPNKLRAFRDLFGERFSYIGNASPDIEILTACREPMVANPSASLRAGLRAAGVTPVQTFTDTVSARRSWLKAIRLHQWAKNILIFLPLLLAHGWREPHPAASALGAIMAFFSFGLVASATYIVNDLLDIEADRRHHSKRRRPFAAGYLSPLKGIAVLVLFLVLGFSLAAAEPLILTSLGVTLPYHWGLLAWLLLYALSTTAYSFVLKRMVLVDVIMLSGLYTIRIMAGADATGFKTSQWLGGFAVFFFLSLAFVKRFAELESLRSRDLIPSNGRGYQLGDIEQLRSFGTASGYASVVVLLMYIWGIDSHLYHHSGRLWLLLPVLLLWVSQLWLTASRGELNEDPVVHAITDKQSLLLGALSAVIVLSAI